MKNALAYLFVLIMLFFSGCSNAQSDGLKASDTSRNNSGELKIKKVAVPSIIDSLKFREKMISMSNGDTSKWLFNGHYPLSGAILPFYRVIAYYGNLYSTRMGILGELPKPQMFAKLKGELDNWRKADPSTPVMPALHYIVSTAQSSPGPSGKYRLRMPNKEIDKVMAMADEIGAIVFLDIQVGLSTLREEIPVIEKYLSHPRVHLGVDPEFSMKGGEKPGTVIGNFSSEDINYASVYLANLVKKNNSSNLISHGHYLVNLLIGHSQTVFS